LLDINECTLKEPHFLFKTGSEAAQLHNLVKCSANAICVNKIGSYECNCLSGYSGDGFICQDVDECDYNGELFSIGNSCLHISNSKCVNSLGSFQCLCMNGYEKLNERCEG
jgi:fibulin 1/2